MKRQVVRLIYDPIRQKKGEDVAVMANDQPTGEAFHFGFVHANFAVAGDPVYPFAAHRYEHLDAFGSVRIFRARGDTNTSEKGERGKRKKQKSCKIGD